MFTPIITILGLLTLAFICYVIYVEVFKHPISDSAKKNVWDMGKHNELVKKLNDAKDLLGKDAANMDTFCIADIYMDIVPYNLADVTSKGVSDNYIKVAKKAAELKSCISK